MVQGGKRLVGMHREIEQKRYEIRNQLQEYKRKKEMERRRNVFYVPFLFYVYILVIGF